MAKHSWDRKLFNPPAARPTRLRVERLEDRLTPNGYLVYSFADDGSPGTLRSVLAQVNADPAGPGPTPLRSPAAAR